MVGRIDAAARIAVFVPGAADGVVLFDDGEGDAGLLQADGGAGGGAVGTCRRAGQ